MESIDINNVCRLCASNTHLQPMQDNLVIDVFQKLIDVNYSKDDGLPQKICESCIETIFSIQKFVLQCKTVNLSLKKYCSLSKNNTLAENSNSLHAQENNRDTFVISNVVSDAENTINEIQSEELIDDPINCSNETVSLEFNNDDIQIDEHELNCETIIKKEIIIDNTADETENVIETNEITYNTDVANETNATAENVIATDVNISEESRNSMETEANDNNRERYVDLRKRLSELKKQFPFNASYSLLKSELDHVFVQDIELNKETDTQTQQIFIPVSHLLNFDDNIRIINSHWPNV